jgi:hypothetical protein
MAEKSPPADDISDLIVPKPSLLSPPPASKPDPEDISDLSSPAYAGFGEKTAAFGYGSAKGAATSAALLAPTVTGARIGAAVSPFLGPAAPLAPIVGGLAGLGYGLYLTDVIDKYAPGPRGSVEKTLSDLVREAPSELERERERALAPYYAAGETFGGGIAASPLGFTFKSARTGAKGLERLIGSIGDYARANPKQYLSKEALASFYAALAGGMAVDVAPDSPFLRMGAEVTAGILSPGKALLEAKNVVDSSTQAYKEAGTSSAVQQYVSNALTELINQSGEDPQRLANLIRERLKTAPRDPRTGKPLATTAQVLDSPVLTALDRTLANGNAKYSADTKAMGMAALEAQKNLIRALEDTGDPALLNAAAQLRDATQTQNLQNALNLAQINAVAKATALGSRGTENRAAIGNILLGEVEGVVNTGRQTEKELWNAALRSTYKTNFKPVQIRPNNTLEAYLELAYGPQGVTKTDLKKYYSDVSTELKGLGFKETMATAYRKKVQTPEYFESNTVGPEAIEALKIKGSPAEQLVKLRSSWLSAAREADVAGNDRAAMEYSRLAEAALKDLESLPGDAYKDARAFSKNFNDVITRTFAGELDDLTSTGALKYAPEILVRRAFAVGSDPAYLRTKQILEAATKIPGAEGRVSTIRGAQQQILRALAAETVDPTTKEIRLPAFTDFVDKNTDLIKLLGMENEFSNIANAQRALLDLRDPKAPASLVYRDPLYQEEAFAKLLKGSSPASVINKAMNSDNPTGKLKALFAIAKEAGPDAVNGLKSSMYQYAFQKAGGETGFKVAEWEKALFMRPKDAPNQPPLYKIMSDAGLLTFGEVKNMRKLIAPMVRIENSMASKQMLDPSVMPGGPASIASSAEEMAQAWAAARFAGLVSPGGPGSLSFAGRMIGMAKNLFREMPTQKRIDLMVQASQDPALMEALLRRGNTPAEKRDINLGILRRMYPVGIFPTAVERYADSIEPVIEEEPVAAPPPPTTAQATAQRLQRKIPDAPPSRGLLSSFAQRPQPGRPQAQGQPQPQAREMLQRMFPFDAILR